TEARAAADKILRGQNYAVVSVEKKQIRRTPPPPFTTSTLQQESSRKLGLGASRTMRVAQQLYEGVNIGGDTVGLITYMRTDGVTLSGEAIAAARRLIEQDHGREYVPGEARVYRTQAKNAQEAHEAIRPTDMFRRPKQVARYLDADQRALYELVWKRAVASQMEAALIDQVAVDIAPAGGGVTLRATGSTVAFNGFLALYHEDEDDPASEEAGGRLPSLAERQALQRGEVEPLQHFTQPLPRYTEASLVKKLEELGIGRPSTYASILQVLQDRNYVRLEKKRFIPEDRGRLVITFLARFFERYVEYGFTADLENKLDEISGGKIPWRRVLEDFWRDFSAAVDGTKDLKISHVIATLDEVLGRHFFPAEGSGRDPRLCPACQAGRLGLKLGRFGAFIACSNYPNCRYTRPLGIEGKDGANGADLVGPRELGTDPETADKVSLRKGPYGTYVQLGEGEKPKRASLPKGMAASDLTLEAALKLLALPREIGRHPESGEPIIAGIGRFGPYVRHGKLYKSLAPDDDVLTIGLNRAVSLLAEPRTGRGGRQPLRVIGNHPEDGAAVNLYRGRYGPYVNHGGINATVPSDIDPDELTLGQAVALLANQAAKKPAKGKRPRAKPKAAAKRRQKTHETVE
ncbi:MAG: type I DNA topoisomerase, partial [Stellaceae bacterium]